MPKIHKLDAPLNKFPCTPYELNLSFIKHSFTVSNSKGFSTISRNYKTVDLALLVKKASIFGGNNYTVISCNTL